MMECLKTVRNNFSVMVLRPAMHGDYHDSYAHLLTLQGVNFIENITPDSAHRATQEGCRVGLLMLTHAEDLAQLDTCEPCLNLSKITWVGLIAPDLFSDQRVLKFISTYLFNYLTLPVDPERVLMALRHAWSMALTCDTAIFSGRQLTPVDVEGQMVGTSEKMQRLFAQIRKVAQSDATILITGPSGTGKELAALSIHRQSHRSNAPFVAVNCGAISPQLLQSELFGAEKGAYTGAHQRRIGQIEAAQGGDLFLDEIGDMPLDMQINLLRFLQERVIVRVGGTDAFPINVRVIAATHIDLAEAVMKGRFREDLYYRINVVHITMPRLADRGRDIEDIAQYYFAKYSRLHKKGLLGFSNRALEAMLQHSWPGNVRELANCVQRAVVMAEGRYIQPEDLGFASDRQHSHLLSLEDARASTDRVMIDRALSQTRNQVSHAANLLGISRVTLYRLIDKYQIRDHSIADSVATFFDRTK